MLPVSQTWRDAITAHRTSVVRNSMKASVYIGVFDESASPDATLSVNVGQMYYSDFDNLNTASEQACSYATWEQDTFRGDGVQTLCPSVGGNYLKQGWISSEISGASNIFGTNPTITITFTEPHSMVGMTLLFDPYNIADSFTISSYNSGTLLDSDSYSGNTEYEWSDEINIYDADKIIIEFTKTTNPYGRIHLQNLSFGIGYTYDSDQLIDFDFTRENSPLSLTLPKESLRFSLFNEGYKFNVDKTTSMIRFLKNDQKVTATMWYNTVAVHDDVIDSHVWYDFDTGELMWEKVDYYSGSQLSIISGWLMESGNGYKMWIDNNTLYAENSPRWEQLKLCTLWLKSWEVKGSVATFTCEDSFQRLNNIPYNETDYGSSDLNTRLDAMMTYAGYSDYSFNNNPTNVLVFPNNQSVAYNLQLAANRTMSTLEQDPDAVLIMRPRTEPTITSVTANGAVEPYSVVSSIGLSNNATYATYEFNFFSGDGSMSLMGTPYLNNGVVWDQLPVSNTYTDAYLTIELSDNSTFGTLNTVFPEPYQPSTYTIEGYRYSSGTYTKVYEKEVNGFEQSVSDAFDRIKRIVITLNGCMLPQKPRIKTVSLGWETGYDIVSEDLIDMPKGKILTACKDVVANVTSYSAKTGQQVASADVTANTNTTLTFSNPVTNLSISASSGTPSIVSSHAYYAVVKCTANSKVTLTGTVMEPNLAPTTESVNLHGEDLDITNPMITSIPTGYLAWCKAYASKDTEFECETLGFPELDAADLISYKGEPAQIIKHVLTFNSGACRSKFVLRKE